MALEFKTVASQEQNPNTATTSSSIVAAADTTTIPRPQPQPIKVDARYYYNSKDLQAFKPEYYYGCVSKPRNIITKKGIPNWEYVYATFVESLKKWNLSTEGCKKAQLLISKQWVDDNYFKPSSSSSTIDKKKTIIIKKTTLKPQPQLPQTPPRKLEEHDVEEVEEGTGPGHQEYQQQEQQEIENAPPLLHLDDSEKFHDADGNIIEIETRGERHRKKIYFKVKDVSVGFGMPSLSKNILRHRYVDVENGYEYGLHYKAFKRVPSGESNKQEMTLYLTYKGLLRVLFVSRNKNVDKFQDWAEEKLFTIQMGTRDQKVKLGAEVLNTSPRTLKAIFDKHASTFPSIYLVSLGKVRDLRETFGIPADKPDDSTVYKFGFSEDLSRRVMELESDYSKLPGVTMQIATFQIIDVKYTSEAESEVRDTCSAFELRVKKTTQGKNELIVLDDKQFANLKKLYRRIGDEFAGATLGLQKQVADLKERIKEYENEVMHLNTVIKHKDEMYKKNDELKDTVIENWKLKHQLATMTNNTK